MQRPTNDGHQGIQLVRRAALDTRPITGLTHRFYRYPARFSPMFARACIEAFSEPGQVVLDPYMGGGTTIVEALATGRLAVGSDINSLAVFVTSAKVSRLDDRERRALVKWAGETVSDLKCNYPLPAVRTSCSRVPRNMTIPAVRWLKKTISLCIESIQDNLPTARTRAFARCVLLNVGQWALNGRRRIPSATEFRLRVVSTTNEMLSSVSELSQVLSATDVGSRQPVLRQNDAEYIDRDQCIRSVGPVDLVVTSPPYPGIHMLYHRWQVDGRKETDAPYWIAACTDGSGATYYNFADRRIEAEDRYFAKATRSFKAIRQLMRAGAILAQTVAFSEPERQLRRYMNTMKAAGFDEMREHGQRRTWRIVPSRRWHATFKGELASSREVVLLHVAV